MHGLKPILLVVYLSHMTLEIGFARERFAETVGFIASIWPRVLQYMAPGKLLAVITRWNFEGRNTGDRSYDGKTPDLSRLTPDI